MVSANAWMAQPRGFDLVTGEDEADVRERLRNGAKGFPAARVNLLASTPRSLTQAASRPKAARPGRAHQPAPAAETAERTAHG
ncbi:hypothetical protein D7193_11025 [Micromonospora costi]|uniref:Uncharacterized protein n=1 Tax=Micromonospora costi TaxID=1530042 RepID=A0A3B0A3X6_9ACTN|nr:hypothetical protein D7193_11025 [Micromonospora costi]